MDNVYRFDRLFFDCNNVKIDPKKSAVLVIAFCALWAGVSPSNAADIPRKVRQTATTVSLASSISDADWTALNSGGIYGASGPVYAEICYKNRLYIGGNFIAVGTTLAKNIAQWDGSTWSGLGSGVDSTVLALAIDSAGALYAGGTFSHAGGISTPYIARWNGNTWSGLGSGSIIDQQTLMGPSIMSITIDRSGIVYAAGRFDAIAGVTASKIARWDGASWSPIGDHLRFHRDIYALACDKQGILYAGGEFDTAGTVFVRNIAKWNGLCWDSLGAGIQNGGYSSPVSALLCEENGDLLAGGGFSAVGDTMAYNIARWDGARWHPLGGGLPASENGSGVYALAKSPTGALCAAGTLNYVNFDTTSSDIALWNGQKWSPLGVGFYGKYSYRDEDGHYYWKRVQALAFDNNGNLFAGGTFQSAGGKKIRSFAQWDGGSWAPVGTVISGPVRDIVNAVLSDHRGSLFVGGIFDGGVARLSAGAWSALGGGIQGTVLTMSLDSSGNIYAAGLFDSADGHKAKNIAKWDGTKWSALDLGLSPGPIRSLVCGSDGKMFAAGDISSAGRVAARCIATWDGYEWDSLPRNVTSINATINAIAFDAGRNLVAAGSFRLPGDDYLTYYLAQWNGVVWDTVKGWQGWVEKNVVSTVAFDGRNNCYLSIVQAIDQSTYATTRCAIVKCDGGTPQRLATITGRVSSLALDRSGNLYAAGKFDSVVAASGYVKARGVAKFGGKRWEALGSGVAGDVGALAVEDSTLFVGGKLYTAGTAWSPYIAKVNIHNVVPAVLPKRQAGHGAFHLHCTNAVLTISGCEERDEILLYSLSGNLLKRRTGASRILLHDLPSQMIVVRVRRDAAILGSRKVMVEWQ